MKVSNLSLTQSASWKEDTMQELLLSGKQCLSLPLYNDTPSALATAALVEGRILLLSQSQPWSLHSTKTCALCCSFLYYLNVTCILSRLQPSAVPRTSPSPSTARFQLCRQRSVPAFSVLKASSYFPLLVTIRKE